MHKTTRLDSGSYLYRGQRIEANNSARTEWIFRFKEGTYYSDTLKFAKAKIDVLIDLPAS